MKRLKYLALSCAMAIAMCACGSSGDVQVDTSYASESSETGTQTGGQTTETQSTGAQSAIGAQYSAEMEKVLGDWTLIYSDSYYKSSDGESNYFYFYGVSTEEEEEDDYYNIPEGIKCYSEDGRIRMDYESESNFGMELVPVNTAAYDGCGNTSWSMQVKYGSTVREYPMGLTLISDNVLELVSEYYYSDSEEFSRNVLTFFRNGSEEYRNNEDYRYKKNVTVSNAKELIAALESNSHITLKAGSYDLTDNAYYSGLNNVFIEAEAGAEVELYTDQPADNVLELVYCSDIIIKGVTAGHHVEPGYCGGNVFSYSGCSDVTVEDCKLYGCGVYGISAYDTYNGWVSNTDIYECSDGLVDLIYCGNWTFDDCLMRDTKGGSLINAYNGWSLNFQNCTFRGNEVGAECYFVASTEVTLSFNGCTFEGLEKGLLCDTEVNTVNCTFK